MEWFYNLFNSISVISGQEKGISEGSVHTAEQCQFRKTHSYSRIQSWPHWWLGHVAHTDASEQVLSKESGLICAFDKSTSTMNFYFLWLELKILCF